MKYEKEVVAIVIPALNEEKNIENAINTVIKSARAAGTKFKIYLIDDGSTDSTGKIADSRAKRNKQLIVLHNKVNLGLGKSFRVVLKQIESNYITVFPGDNDMSGESLKSLLKSRNEADIITSYMKNKTSRSFFRRQLSKMYVNIINFLFRTKLNYFTGPFICKTGALAELSLKSDGLDIYSEIKIRLIHKGYSYKEISFLHIGRFEGRSKAVGFKSFYQIVRNTSSLFIDIYSDRIRKAFKE